MLLSTPALLVAACGTNVLLGGAVDAASQADAPPDGGASDAFAPDAHLADAAFTTPPFENGAYSMSIAPTPMWVDCTHTLAGMESAFSGITRDGLGLAEGAVELRGVDPTHIEISGAPIESGFGAPSVNLERAGGPGVPEDTWVGIGARAPEGGPAGTILVGLALEAHALTVGAGGFDGRASALFADPLVEDAQCIVGLATRFDVL